MNTQDFILYKDPKEPTKDAQGMAHAQAHSGQPTEEASRLLRPSKATFIESLKNLFWDSDDKTCCTRTPINWLSITVYYIIFLSIVSGMMFLTLMVVKMIADQHPHRPAYILGDSPIGRTPCLNFFPMPYVRAPLIWLEKDRPLEIHLDIIKKQIEFYQNHPDEKCKNILETLGECKGDSDQYGYDEYQPCIFFRLNRLLEWIPTPYNKTDTLPKEIPDRIKELINSGEEMVWLDCQGTTAKDVDRFENNLQYWPDGFQKAFFPYKNQKDFCDPLVAMRFNKKIENLDRIASSISCSVWGKDMDVEMTKVDIVFYFEY